MQVASAWSNAKRARANQLAKKHGVNKEYYWLCEICHRENGHNGHHIVPRSKNGADCLSNVRLTCDDCEQLCHEKFKDGNPPDWWIEQRREFFEKVR